ncbi:MAG: hypothetical protein HY290_03605 [Planctomycetia bacterium]|nr:hypothetical protein [Planctomycetia bacterium]
MCCFSRNVEHVSNTNIFARSSKENRQFVVYSMKIQTKEDLAMILPIPVPKESPDDAVRFISLKGYATFFDDMPRGFPQPKAAVASRSTGGVGSLAEKSKPLPVVEVGDFGASFVPSIKDFSRLDERFRLPDAAWDQLPRYRDYGFAVFKLKEGEAKKQQKVHPMAFEFPRAEPAKLFFPTVHIHDGKVHERADFDHILYCQVSDGQTHSMMDWAESMRLAGQFLKVDKTEGIVDAGNHCYKRGIRGKQKNEDVLV